MTRRELYAEQRGLMLGTICGITATCIAGAAVVLGLRATSLETIAYLMRVVGCALLVLGLVGGGAWVTWRALAWARGGSR